MSYSINYWLCCLALLCGMAFEASGQWKFHKLDTKASFRGLSVVNDKVIWASGTEGTYLRTTDGGANWEVSQAPDAEKLDFRDVEAFDADTAYLLSVGPGDNSRIYKTTDGGKSWHLQFKNQEKAAFFDALAFWDKNHGLAMSDPVNGRFLLLETTDGGAHWTPLPENSRPPAIEGEGGFAASGTCLITNGKREAYLVSGGARAQVYYSPDFGRTWQAFAAPLSSGPAGAGIFSIARRGKTGLIVGGDYQNPTSTEKNAAFTLDGGKSWQPALKAPGGFRSGVAFSRKGKLALAVGATGSDVSRDGGRNWERLDGEDFNAVAATPGGAFWAVGPRGRVAQIVLSSK